MIISFEAGQGKHFPGWVNFMKSDDGSVYAEVSVPDGASDDFGYLTLKDAFRDAYKGKEPLTFWFDGMEKFLEPDAHDGNQIYVEVSR